MKSCTHCDSTKIELVPYLKTKDQGFEIEERWYTFACRACQKLSTIRSDYEPKMTITEKATAQELRELMNAKIKDLYAQGMSVNAITETLRIRKYEVTRTLSEKLYISACEMYKKGASSTDIVRNLEVSHTYACKLINRYKSENAEAIRVVTDAAIQDLYQKFGSIARVCEEVRSSRQVVVAALQPILLKEIKKMCAKGATIKDMRAQLDVSTSYISTMMIKFRIRKAA